MLSNVSKYGVSLKHAQVTRQAATCNVRVASQHRFSLGSSRTTAARRAVIRIQRRSLAIVASATAVAPARRPKKVVAPTGPTTLSEESYVVAEKPVTVHVQREPNGAYTVAIGCGLQAPVVMHWGINNWNSPPKECWPEGTNPCDGKAVQSQFRDGKLRITFAPDAIPENITFVLKQTSPEAWYNCGGGDFRVVLQAPAAAGGPAAAMLAQIAQAEGWERFSLFQRFCLALEVVPPAERADVQTMAVAYTWLRYSANQLLPWYKGNNYQSKDIAHVQETLAQRMADLAAKVTDPTARLLARQSLSTLPRGGGNGDEIRMGILHMMRANGIKEGHRPGIEDKFLEEWHQKLHTNTTPDDVAICEAYLHFLHCGNWDEFYRHIWENHGISRQKLETMDHPIRHSACHLPHLIPPMKHFLWVLKITHSGANLDTAMEFSKSHLDGELQYMIYDILANRNEWWVPGKIADVRGRLAHNWRRAEGAPRDVVMLDIALDKHFRLCVERTEKGALTGDNFIDMVELVLRNACIAGEWPELEKAHGFWQRVQSSPDRWSKDWALRACAAADFVTVALEACMDRLAGLVQKPAQTIGAAGKVEQAYITNFAEEVVRSQTPFLLGDLLGRLSKPLRASAGLGPWTISSTGAGGATGRLLKQNLEDVQGQEFPEPTILLSDRLGGLEDIPAGIVAVIVPAAVDVLSHVALRARSQSVLLASCEDAEQLATWTSLIGSPATVSLAGNGDVVASASSAPLTAGPAAEQGAASAASVAAPAGTSAWVIGEDDFAEGLVGGKGLKCMQLRKTLSDADVAVPASISLPFGTFERVLAAPVNASTRLEVEGALAELDAAAASGASPSVVSDHLQKVRELVGSGLSPPDGLSDELSALAKKGGLVEASADMSTDSDAFWDIWEAVCKVWASKWTDRAWLSRRTRGFPDSALYMSVLLQKIVPAQYAFVLHTADPLTGAPDSMFGEVVVGLGEALVGNFPGRALSFSTAKGSDSIAVKTLPSKIVSFTVDNAVSLIARSDSNGEDLEGFAGAGLYDSVPVNRMAERTPCYQDVPLLWDTGLQNSVLKAVAQVGWKVEAALGGNPVDIEGVVLPDGKVAVVQARPQIIQAA